MNYYVRMDVPASHTGACGIRFDFLPERQILTALTLLFSLLFLTTITSDVIAKESRNICEEIQILQGVQDATAVIGRIFFYPISPFAFQGKISHYKVTLANGSALPKWLEYNPNAKTLQGLPLLEESGKYHLAIFAYGDACSQKTPAARANFQLHVQESHLANNTATDPNQKCNSVGSGALCVKDISVTFAEIIISAPNTLEIRERLYLICTMADYLHLDPSSLTLTTFSNHLRNLTVLAEDIRYINPTKQHSMGIYWPVGFGVFAMMHELIQVLQHNVESNNLSQLLGFEISGWRVLKKESNGKKHSRQRRRRYLMATPRPVLRPTSVETFTHLSHTLTQSIVKPIKSSSLLYDIIPTYTDAFLHSVINQKDLQTTDLEVLLNVQTQALASPMFQDVSSELLPSLMSASTELKVVSQTPPISELQPQVPQDIYSTFKKSEPDHDSTLYDSVFLMPVRKTQLSSPFHHIMDTCLSPQVISSGKRLSLECFSRETTDQDYNDLCKQTALHLLSEDTLLKVKLALPSIPSTDLTASSGFPCLSIIMSLLLSDGSYDNEGLLSNYKYATELFLCSPAFNQNTGFSMFGITSMFETTARSTTFALKLELLPNTSSSVQTYYSGKIQTLAIYSAQELRTSLFANFMESGLLTRTSSILAMFPSQSLYPPMELTTSFGLSNIFLAEELWSNGRQHRPAMTQVYEHAPESFMISQTHTHLITKYNISAITSIYMETFLQQQQLHFFSVTGSNNILLSSKFIGKEEETKQISENYSYETSVLASPIEFASSPKLDVSVNEYGFYDGNVVTTLFAHHDFLQLHMSVSSLESSFETKRNIQVASESLTTPVQESTLLSNKEMPAQNGFYATTLCQGAEDTNILTLASDMSPQGIGAIRTPLFPTSQIMPIDQINNSPRVVNALKWITATIGYKFFFSIPEDTFYDQEDGNTTQLTLGIIPTGGSPTGLESWLQFNSSYQTMYGYPLDIDFQYSPQEFLLFATDSGGLRTSNTFTIEMLRQSTTPCHIYTVRTKNSYHSFLRNRENVNLFFEKLSNYLTTGRSGNMVILHLKPGSTRITWYSESFCTTTSNCARDEIQDVLLQLGVPGRKLNPNFVEAMLPDYKIYQIEDVEYGGTCSSTIKQLNESLVSNKTLTTFQDYCSWVGNLFSILLIGICTAVLVILIVTLHFCKYQKGTVGSQSASVNERPLFTYIDLEMDMLRPRKSPVLDQEAPQSAQLWLSLPPPSHSYFCRSNTTHVASSLPPPPRYKLPPPYVMKEPSQMHHDFSYRF
ncbi:uncharacterized protein LOC103278953 [Anolis carolinensis]|uniref:uncharacterized protein LOC103278953 n=1 Tax=Anolis carolinensis TaxID=28377 RepID=UPI002F2B8CE1